MGSIVIDLQKELLDNKYPLSQLMIKAYVVAKKLKLDDYVEQFKKEIDGYSTWENVPEYRKIDSKIQKGYGTNWNNVFEKNIIGSLAGSGRREAIYSVKIKEPIRKIEKHSEESVELTSKIDGYISPLRFDLPVSYNYSSSDFRVIYNTNQYIDLLHNAKMFLIEWTLMLTENGILGDNMSFGEDEKKMAHQVINAHTVQVQNNPVHSSQNMTINNNQLEIFDKLLDAAESIKDNMAIISSINEMKSAIMANDKPGFKDRYDNFIQSAANHMTLFAPLIHGLTGFF